MALGRQSHNAAPFPDEHGEVHADAETGEVTETQAVGMIAEAFGKAGVEFSSADDPMSVQRDIVQRVMSATSLDELFGNWEVTTSDKLEGRTLTILGAEWTTYNSEAGPIPLARVKAEDVREHSTFTFVTTAPNLTAFIARAQQIGALPFTAKIEGSKTARGFTSLHFVRA